jgi:methylase of polypeptide subunit release factors
VVPTPELARDLPGDLRDALTAASFTYDEVADVLGSVAHAALSRNETTPGIRATRGGTPVETLTRLWLLQAPVPAPAAEAALPGLVDRLCAAGILERSVGEVAARVDVRPYGTDQVAGGGNLWVASDLTPGLDGAPNAVGSDHVLGISSAATSLAEMTVRDRVDSALDLGTGCGVQSLHLAAHSRQVVATDVNPRALWLTRLNAGLNGVSTGSTAQDSTGSTTGGIDVREGSFFEPVRGETFDLVVSNPPFVISPATGERLVYRDSGMPGDAVVEHIVRAAPGHLTEGGLCQVLGNWMVLRDQPWEERLTGWIAGCDAWVVQRETVDLPTYVELWLKDAGLHPSTGTGSTADYVRRYDTWLAWFEEQGAEAVGFGWIHLRRVSTGTGEVHRLEDWPYAVAQPLGDEVAAHFRRTTQLRGLSDARLLATRPVARPDVVQETLGAPGAEDPGRIVLRQQVGQRRARQVDTAEAALVGACDGELTVAQILAALAQILGAHGVSTGVVRDLVADGFLVL